MVADDSAFLTNRGGCLFLGTEAILRFLIIVIIKVGLLLFIDPGWPFPDSKVSACRGTL